MAVDATPMGTDSNSFGTLAEADLYFSERRLNGAPWAATAEATRNIALINATTLLEKSYRWYGTIRMLEQHLSWPRAGVMDRNNRYYNYDVVPMPVKEAQFELALALLARDRTAEPKLLGQGFSKVKVDVIEITVDPKQVIPLIPATVMGLLEEFGEPLDSADGEGGFRQIRLER